ncbi:MAG: hypothetical protein F6K39_03195 [Okeania sp. SIO3B3]|nr:hypothetical protein [Okeania sp. SIO3B3]
MIKKSEESKLKYLGGVAKNRKVIIINNSENERDIRLDKLLKIWKSEIFEEVLL